uniref:Uncharacterized protein n=1 Tax=Avena sativa TaxID=4498 RepID=A0ACD5WZ83_AVESA
MWAADAAYDRAAELRALDATFAGVRGLVASGITHVPRIFRVPEDVHHHEPPHEPAVLAGVQQEPAAAAIPVINLGSTDRAAVVAAVGRAAAEWGFFQVTGHGVPPESVAAAVDATRAFHEAPGGEGTDKACTRGTRPGLSSTTATSTSTSPRSPTGATPSTSASRPALPPPTSCPTPAVVTCSLTTRNT